MKKESRRDRCKTREEETKKVVWGGGDNKRAGRNTTNRIISLWDFTVGIMWRETS